MKPVKHPGTCLLCRETVGKKGAQRHLENCLAHTGWPEESRPSYIIRVDGRRASSSWMYILARHDAEFSDLDSLLTDVWMGEEDDSSAFIIGGLYYIDVKTKKHVPLSERLEEGQIFSYLHRAHSPQEVELKCKVVGMTPLVPPEGPCCLLARNTPDLPPCCMCGDPAEFVIVDPYAFDLSEETDGGKYCCIDCLMVIDTDGAVIRPVANSPCPGASFSLDDLECALDWYPPGWDLDDLVSVDAQDIIGSGIEITDGDLIPRAIFGKGGPFVMMECRVLEDIGLEIEMFLIDEEEFGKDVRLSEEIVRSFCTVMYGIYEVDIDHWDAAVLCEALLGDMVRNPHATPEWAKQVIPVLCRFLDCAAAEGRDVDVEELFPALNDVEPEFIRRVAAQNNWEIETDPGYAGLCGVDFGEDSRAGPDGITELLMSAMLDVVEKYDGKEEADAFRRTMEGLIDEGPGVFTRINVRSSMIFGHCDEFCTRLNDESVAEDCGTIVSSIAVVSDLPLMRDSEEIWGGAIVFVACRNAGLIPEGEESSPLEEEICAFFGLTPPALRARVAEVQAYLSDAAEEG